MKRFVLGIVLAAAGVSRGGALEVVEHEWGFGGRAVPQRINILSVLVANRSDQPFDGQMTLTKTLPMGGGLGARLVRPCFLSPGATRWVQFYPYLQRSGESWALVWGRGAGGQMTLTSPKLTPPARVLLVQPDDPLIRATKLPTMPDSLFPPTVAATDGSYSIVLDHAPRWEPVRRQAFLDWLHRGGRLHIAHGRDGRYPAFPADLARLNAPLDRFRVGAGLVVRHPVPRGEIDNTTLARDGYTLPAFKTNTMEQVDFSAFHGTVDNLTDDFLQTLTTASRPRHSWALIYLTAIAYIAAVCIFHFFYARKVNDWKRTLVAFGIIVGTCAVLLGVIGKRGQGEAAAVNTVAYARHLGGGQYDVTQWSNAFITAGGLYQMTHSGTHNLYSTCQEEEAVQGGIFNGRQGQFAADIPLFSSRSFLYRGKLQGHHIKVAVRSYEAGNTLRSLVLEPEEGFPTNAAAMYALYRGGFYRLTYTGGRLAVSSGQITAESLLAHRELIVRNAWRGNARGFMDFDEPGPTPRAGFAAFARPLIARAVGGTKSFRTQTICPEAGKAPIELFVYTELPESFYVQGGKLGTRKGFVLYHIPLFPPETPDG